MSADESKKKPWRESDEGLAGESVTVTGRIIGKLSRWWRPPETPAEGKVSVAEGPVAAEEKSPLPAAPAEAAPAAAAVPAAKPPVAPKPGAEGGGSTVDHVLAILTLERVLPELDAARKEIQEQKEASEARIRQLEAERDQARAGRRELEERVQTVGKALDAVEHRLREERETAEGRIHQLEAERNQSRGDADNARVERLRQESHVRVLEEELATARRQLAEEKGKEGSTPRRPAEEAAARLRPLEIALQQAQERSRQLERELAEQEALLESLREEKAAEGASREAAPATGGASSFPSPTAKELYEQAVVPLTVLVASADLMLMNPKLEPSLADTAHEIKTQTQTLLEIIKKYALPSAKSPPPPPE